MKTPEPDDGVKICQVRESEAGIHTSSPKTVLSKKQAKKEEEMLTRELQLITQERNELRDRLMYVTEGAMNKRPYYRPNPFYEKLKLKKKEIMSFLHNLEMENIEARQKFEEHKKEINFYQNLHSRLLIQKDLMNKRLAELKQENKEVHADWTIIQQYLIDLNLNDKFEKEKARILQDQQHQVSKTVAKAEISTSLEEGLLQNELPTQETPAELHPQQPQNSLEESSST
ncbi:disks large homolog 5-like [Apodemus sylvaticus]|uniref:disks large homolog 5-like n=1 Tax=Apodemus sylvaticus TaxID=10129 RepID=UPI002243653E|nr:disks large homolog 5-like [Apodemus sylvaticus]